MKKYLLLTLFSLAPFFCFAQEQAMERNLKTIGGPFIRNYYINERPVSYSLFLSHLGSENKNLSKMFKEGKALNISGVIVGGIGAFGFGYSIGSGLGNGKEVDQAFLYGGLGVMLGGIIMSKAGENKMQKAVKLYNGKSMDVSFRVVSGNSGLGFALVF